MRPSEDEFGDFRWPVTSSRAGEDGGRNLQTRRQDETCDDLEERSLKRRARSKQNRTTATAATAASRTSNRAVSARAASASRMPAIVNAPVPVFMQFIIMSAH
jgi:hypothetical protein